MGLRIESKGGELRDGEVGGKGRDGNRKDMLSLK
jgi:hypothetical protein